MENDHKIAGNYLLLPTVKLDCKDNRYYSIIMMMLITIIDHCNYHYHHHRHRQGAISDQKILVADLSTSRKKRTTVFGNKGGAGEGVTGRLEVFRKFIQNGTVKRPLIPLHTRTNKRTCESTTKVCWGSHCKIHFWGLGSNSIQEISFFRVTRKKSVGARLQLSGIQTLIFWEPRFIYVAVQSWDLKIHSSGSQDFIFWDANFLGIQTFVVYDPNFKIHVIHPTIQL